MLHGLHHRDVNDIIDWPLANAGGTPWTCATPSPFKTILELIPPRFRICSEIEKSAVIWKGLGALVSNEARSACPVDIPFQNWGRYKSLYGGAAFGYLCCEE